MSKSFSAKDLERLLSDIDRQPTWREEASRCADYYDGKQLEPDVVAAMKERGQPVLIHNLIGPTIDGVLGMEAKTRQSFMVRAENDENLQVAEALNEEVSEMARMTNVDRAIADAFAGQIKTGLGWVEVNRSSDEFEYPYQSNYVHRDEIWWDWHSKAPDLHDARWLLRRRWLDEDEAAAFFPKHRDLIKYAAGGWANALATLEMQTRPQLMSAYQDYADNQWREDELFDTDRHRVRVHEVYYRVFERGLVMRMPDGRRVRFERNNPMHVAVVNAGHAELVNAPYKRMYQAWYIGPHLIYQGPSQHPHNNFPYVPFWGFREDTTNVPYGLIRRMLSPQDEVNFRRSKLTYLLNSKRIIKDDDATAMSDQDLIDEVNRPDGVVTLNKDRKNVEHRGFWVETESGIAVQQFQIMQDAKQNIQDCGGVFSAMLGQESNATSGVAIHGLIEQGSTTMAELFDNYRFARQKVGELMLAFKVQEIGRQPRRVMVNVNKPEPTAAIDLNQVTLNEQGQQVISNDVMRTKASVVLDDIVNTPGYRAHLTQRMMELVQTLPPNLQAAVIDLVIMSTDVPKKDEFIKRIRRATGIGVNPEDMSEEERAQWQQQQQTQAMQNQLAMQELQTKIAGLEADAKRKLAAASKDEAAAQSQAVKDELTEAQTLKVLGELKQLTDRLQGSAFLQAGHNMPVPQMLRQ